MWRSSKSLFCCEQHRTADSAILFKVSMRFHWSLDPSFCCCMMCTLVEYFRNWLVYLLFLEMGWSAVVSLPMKRNKANQPIRIKERGTFEKNFNLLKNYRWHSLLWYLIALCQKNGTWPGIQRGIDYSIYISLSIHSANVNGHCAAPSMLGWHPTGGLLCGMRWAAAIQVGKSALKLRYCCKLGLGVLDNSITISMGARTVTELL
jgi:hypothetical protein